MELVENLNRQLKDLHKVCFMQTNGNTNKY